MAQVGGTFEVKLTPQPLSYDAEGAPLGRLSIDKQFRGGLEATSRGEMLSGGAPATGSAGYVAIERVSGALQGRRGTFMLQHNGTMNRGDSQLTVSVIADSGTGELSGLSGRMTIRIDNGQHFYEFDYTLSGEPQPE